MKYKPAFTLAVEGEIDAAIMRRIAHDFGLSIVAVHGESGKDYLRKKIGGYNHAAEFEPWAVLVDLNDEERCAPILVSNWLPNRARYMNLRVAVHEIESWLLADRERFLTYFQLPTGDIPSDTDGIPDPKAFIIRLLAKSTDRKIRECMLPTPGSGRSVGYAYALKVKEFAMGLTDRSRTWRPEVAQQNSDSLRRCIKAIKKIRTIRHDPALHT